MGNFLVMMVCTQYPRAQWPVGLVVKLIPSAKRCIRSDCWHFQMEVKLTPKTREFIFRHISYANLRAAILNSLYICTLMDFYYSICFRKTTFNILLVFEKKTHKRQSSEMVEAHVTNLELLQNISQHRENISLLSEHSSQLP